MVHALTQTNISWFSVLRTFTTLPEHSSVEHTDFFDWPKFAPEFYPSEYASAFGICLSVNISARSAELAKAVCNLQHYTVERALCLLQHFAFFDNCFGWDSVWNWPEVALCCPCTAVDNQARSGRSFVTGARDKLAGSETLGVRTNEDESWRLSRSSCFIYLCKKSTHSVKHTDFHWLNFWAPWWSSSETRLLRWSACFCFLALVLLFGSFCILSELDVFAQDIHPWLVLQVRPMFLLGCRCTFSNFQVSSDLDQCTRSTRAWTFRSKLHFFPHLAEISHYLFSVLVRQEEFHSSFPWEWLDVGKYLE